MMISFQCFFYHSKGSVYHVLDDDDGDDLATKLIMFHDVLGSKSYLYIHINSKVCTELIEQMTFIY